MARETFAPSPRTVEPLFADAAQRRERQAVREQLAEQQRALARNRAVRVGDQSGFLCRRKLYRDLLSAAEASGVADVAQIPAHVLPSLLQHLDVFPARAATEASQLAATAKEAAMEQQLCAKLSCLLDQDGAGVVDLDSLHQFLATVDEEDTEDDRGTAATLSGTPSVRSDPGSTSLERGMLAKSLKKAFALLFADKMSRTPTAVQASSFATPTPTPASRGSSRGRPPTPAHGFQPTLTPRTERLAVREREAFEREHGPVAARTCADRLLTRGKMVDERLEAQRAEAEYQDTAECTFRPALRTGRGQSQPARTVSRHALLYYQGVEARERAAELSAEAKAEKQEAEVRECTFKPRLTPRARREGSARCEPRAYREAVCRLRAGSAQRERARAAAAHIPRGENYERMRAKPPAPPNLGVVPPRSKPFLSLEVHIGAGRKGHLSLREGDDPAALATRFAKVYSLTASHRDKLERIIAEQLAAAGQAEPPGRTAG